jgi:hypothetical protein
LWIIAGLLAIAGLALVLHYRTQIWPVSIKSILDHPRAYSGRTVMIQGRVGNSYAIESHGAYWIEDSTAAIIVITDWGAPEPGLAVRITGKVDRNFRVGKGRMLVLVEQPR